MHDLIVRYFAGEITAEEKTRLFTMMDTDAELRKQFLYVQNLRGLMASLPQEEDHAFASKKLLSFKNKNLNKSKTILFPFKSLIGYAAALCVAVFSVWHFTNKKEEKEVVINKPLLTYEEVSTKAGEWRELKLQDGSTVWLNAGSTLKYPTQFAGGERKVILSGEAFFDVAHDESSPFIVSTETHDIKVLGTKFNVFAYKGTDDFQTSLLEGSVKVYESDDECDAIFIEPNEQVRLIGDKLVKSRFKNTDFLLWKEGIYAFDDVSFEDMVQKLEYYYNIEILVYNSNLAKQKFSGKFRQADGIETILKNLQKIKCFSFQKDEKHNSIIIR